MDEGFHSLVAHFTGPPIDIPNETAGSDGNFKRPCHVLEA